MITKKNSCPFLNQDNKLCMGDMKLKTAAY